MISKINLPLFLEFINKNKPAYKDYFHKKNSFNKASYIVYLHEYIKQLITQENNNKKTEPNIDDTLFIPIDIDSI